MEKSPRAKYSPEFRQQSIRFFKESGLVLVDAAKRLSLPKGTLKNWIYADKQGELAGLGEKERVLYDGGDWEANHRQLAKEQAMRNEAGLSQEPKTTEPSLPPQS